MNHRSLLRATALIVLLPLAAQAAIVIDTRFAYPSLSGSPEIGDIGRTERTDIPEIVPSLGLGWQFTPRIGAGLRYTYFGEVVAHKVSPTQNVFPVDGPVLPALRHYELLQTSHLLSIVVPLTLFERNQIKVTLAPLLQVEWADVEIDAVMPQIGLPDPAALTLPATRTRLFEQRETDLRAGGELTFAYAVGLRGSLLIHYAYSALQTSDVHFFGAGFSASF